LTTKEWLIKLLGKSNGVVLKGQCHDCKKDVSINIEMLGDEEILSSGPLWHIDGVGEFIKCMECFDTEPHLTNYQPCEIYSRVCGYLRPKRQYNVGKQAEFDMRTNYKLQ